MPKRLEGAKSELESLYTQLAATRAELEKPFLLAEELSEKEVRLVLLNADLNMEGDTGSDEIIQEGDAEVGDGGEYIVESNRASPETSSADAETQGDTQVRGAVSFTHGEQIERPNYADAAPLPEDILSNYTMQAIDYEKTNSSLLDKLLVLVKAFHTVPEIMGLLKEMKKCLDLQSADVLEMKNLVSALSTAPNGNAQIRFCQAIDATIERVQGHRNAYDILLGQVEIAKGHIKNEQKEVVDVFGAARPAAADSKQKSSQEWRELIQRKRESAQPTAGQNAQDNKTHTKSLENK